MHPPGGFRRVFKPFSRLQRNPVFEPCPRSTRQQVTRFPPTIISAALRKLDVLAAAHELVDLRMPPGNRLEALKGGLEGFYSIRINDQWRIVFRWENGGADQVAIID